VDTLATVLNISIGSAHGRALRQLTNEHKLKHVPSCRAFLTCYHAEGEDFLAHIVLGDETWVHYYEPESKRQPMEW
jgi:hypothetical protein